MTQTEGTQAGQEPTAAPAEASPALQALLPDFEPLTPRGESKEIRPLNQLLDVSCSLTAELGRMQVSIADVLKLHAGAVLELDRLVSEPVDLVIQGVKFARGEVVVVNDHFAVRIKEFFDPKQRS